MHFKSAHSQQNSDNDFEPIILERKVKQIKCKYCPVIFNTSVEYKEHLDTSHSDKKSGTSLIVAPISPKVNIYYIGVLFDI